MPASASQTSADPVLYAHPVPTIKDDALCIRHWDWSETSQTVSLFTRTHGVLRGLAKGSRRENSSFSGGIELATRGELVAITKSGPSTGALATLTAWDLTETFPSIRRSLLPFRISMAVLDCLSRSVQDADPHPTLFDATITVLRATADNERAQRAALVAYLFSLLKETGHAPELLHDIVTGAELPGAGVLGFLPGRGGFSAQLEGSLENQTMWRTRAETLLFLREIAAGSAAESASIDSLNRGMRLLSAYLECVVESDIPALRALHAAESA